MCENERGQLRIEHQQSPYVPVGKNQKKNIKINTSPASSRRLQNKLNIAQQYIYAYKDGICMNFASRSVIKLLCRE